MIVLLDIEWVGDREKHLTQLSAMRVTSRWWAMERLDILVRPAENCPYDPEHVACGGYPEAMFAKGVTEEECVRGLSEWLQPDDTLWVWAGSDQKVFKELWNKYASGGAPDVCVQSGRAKSRAAKLGLTDDGPYGMLAALGKDPPFPEHRSANDVEVMCQLFSRLDLSPGDRRPSAPPAPKSALPRRARNAIWAKKVPYDYIFAAGSEVFHTRDCKHFLNGRLLLGSKYYAEAAKDRRPCKFCHPAPPPVSSRQELTAISQENRALWEKREKLVMTKLVNGAVQEMRMGRIVGWCHCRLHPGAVSKCILKKHGCLNKGCFHFQKNEISTYWEALENERRAKEKQKMKKQAATAQRSQKKEDLRITKDTWQSYINDLDYDMTIVRVAQPSPWMYTVFYVSGNPFADGNRYPAFLQRVKNNDPRVRICLRHIRAMDGSFVTTDQYRARLR